MEVQVTSVTDPRERAALYSQMARQAERLGDRHLVRMILERYGEAVEKSAYGPSGAKIIPLYCATDPPVVSVPVSQPLWAVIFKTALIPVGMALILSTLMRITLYYCG